MQRSSTKGIIVLLAYGLFAAAEANPLSLLRSRFFRPPANRRLAQYCADSKPNLNRIRTMIVEQGLSPSGEPLYNAVESGSPATVKLLLKEGAQAYPSYLSDHGPVRLAVDLKKDKHLDMFRKQGISLCKNSWSEHLASKGFRFALFAGVNGAYWTCLLFGGILTAIGNAGYSSGVASVAMSKFIKGSLASIPVFGFLTYKLQQKLVFKSHNLLSLAAQGGHKPTIYQIVHGLSDELVDNSSHNKGIKRLNSLVDEALLVAKNGEIRDFITKQREIALHNNSELLS